MNYIAQSPVVPLVELTHYSCRYPIGDPCGDDFGFCGTAKREGSAYCEKHHRLCYERDRYHLDYGKSRIASAWTDSRAADSKIVVWRPRPTSSSDSPLPTITREELHKAHKERRAREAAVALIEPRAPKTRDPRRDFEEFAAQWEVQERARKIAEACTSEETRQAVKHSELAIVKFPSIKRIVSAVSDKYNCPVNAILSIRRNNFLVRVRHIALYLAKELTPCSFPEIGRNFGGRDHTTVLHAVRKIRALIETDLGLRAEIEELRSGLEK